MKRLMEPCFHDVSLASNASKTSLRPFYVYYLTPNSIIVVPLFIELKIKNRGQKVNYIL